MNREDPVSEVDQRPAKQPRWTVVLRPGVLAVLVAAFMCLSGTTLLIADWWLVGFKAAFTRALHDPAKMHFHLFVLPIAWAVFVYGYPRKRMATVLTKGAPRLIAGTVLMVFIVCALNFAWKDSRDGFEKRIAPPQSFGSEQIRKRLLEADEYLRTITPADAESNKSVLGGCAKQIEANRLALPAVTDLNTLPQVWPKPVNGLGATAQYDQLSRLLVSEEAGLRKKGVVETPQFGRDASVRTWICGCLTFLGLLLPIFFVWTGGVYRLGKGWKKFKSAGADGFPSTAALSLTLMAVWLIGKIYSEWYSKFYSPLWSETPELIVAFCAAIVALVILLLMRVSLLDKGNLLTAVTALGTAIGAVIIKISPSLVSVVGQKYLEQRSQDLVWMYVLGVVVTAVVIGAWYSDSHSGNEDSTPLPVPVPKQIE